MPEENWITDTIFTVEEFLSPEVCEEYIRLSEDIGFEDALVSSPQGQVLRSDVRNNQRVMCRDDELAERLWKRACEYIPQEVDGRSAIGVNELLRFYRYDPGQQFDWHQDFPYERDNGESSCLTLMVYLNADFEGGETSFEDSYSEESFEEFQITPQRGMALFFEHETYHKGEPVIRGRKYVLRTDVMFSEIGEDDEDAEDNEDDW